MGNGGARSNLEDIIKQLRVRKFAGEAPTESGPADAAEVETADAVDEQADPDDGEAGVGETEDCEVETTPSDRLDDLSAAVEQVSQEIRKLGREMFKSNRAYDRDIEMSQRILEELKRVTTDLNDTRRTANEQVFRAKALLCEDVFRVIDVLETSMSGAREMLATLEDRVKTPRGFWARLSGTRRQDERLGEIVSSLRHWCEGQGLLRERLVSALRSAGVLPIECAGKPFNPEVHRAVSVERRSDIPSGTIIAEEQPGYVLDGRVLRYAEVVVAKND
jgi:molecular chaperone GrpE (heat shock protein)